jgi:hypothetical protein
VRAEEEEAFLTIETWEYASVYVGWDADGGDWVASFGDMSDIEDLVGWSSTLNYFGQQGWELVNFAPEDFEITGETRGGGSAYASSWTVSGYRLFFKKPLDASA